MSLENKQFEQSGGHPEITIAFFSYSQEAINLFEKAQESRLRLGHKTLSAEHMLIGAMESPVGRRVFDNLFNCDIDPIAVTENAVTEKQIAETMKTKDKSVEEISPISEEGKEAIRIAADQAQIGGVFQITDEHLLKGLMGDNE